MSKRSVSTSHPLAPGRRVTIFGILVGRRPFIEGTAEIIRLLAKKDGLCEVHFIGEPRHLTRRRIIHPEWQADPEAALAALLREWRASLSPDLLCDFDLLCEPKRRGTKKPRRATRSTNHRGANKAASKKEIR
jgi:hypothetical protein